MDIKNSVVIITGGASGMGAAAAQLLAARGAKIAILDLNLTQAEKIAQEINGVAIQCDVSDAGNAATALTQAQTILGPARVLINCAGVAPAKRIVGRNGAMPLEDFRKVIDVNLIGSFNLLRLAAAAMSQLEPLGDAGERGVIINTASIAAFEGQIGQAAYSASKGGIVALTLPAARELAQFAIRVVAIAPGIMETPMLRNMPQEVQTSLEAMIPFPKRLGKPEEFAKLAAHIIDNAYINGEVIRLDGAIRMREK